MKYSKNIIQNSTVWKEKEHQLSLFIHSIVWVGCRSSYICSISYLWNEHSHSTFTIFITLVTKLRDKLKISRQKVKRVILPGKFSRAVPCSQWVWPYSVSLSMLARHVAPVAASASSVARTLKRRLGQAYSLFVYDVGLQLLYRQNKNYCQTFKAWTINVNKVNKALIYINITDRILNPIGLILKNEL